MDNGQGSGSGWQCPQLSERCRVSPSVYTTQRFAIELPVVFLDSSAAEAAFRHGRSGRSPYRHHAEPGVEVYVDVQNQVAWPSGKRAKFSHGPCDNRDAGFNFDPQVIAVAKEMLLHRLDCLD